MRHLKCVKHLALYFIYYELHFMVTMHQSKYLSYPFPRYHDTETQ